MATKSYIKAEQLAGATVGRWFVVGPVTKRGGHWCLSGITHATIIYRIKAGWPENIAVTAPKGYQFKREPGRSLTG